MAADTLWAQSLGVRKRLLVWLPPSYHREPARRYPVALYLHGLWGSEGDWITQASLNTTLDSLVAAGMPEIIVAMPDGDDGWYTTWNTLGDYAGCRREFTPRQGDRSADSYCVPWLHYDDYIARDVVQYLDATYRTQARRERRAIAGLSMGGYGAVSIALQYPDVFSVAASHSGVLSPRYDGDTTLRVPPAYATSPAQLKDRYGRLWPLIHPAFGPDSEGWLSRDPTRRVSDLWRTRRNLMPAIMFDIGTDDGLLGQNRAFRWELQRLGVPHTYAEWPGKHDWAYWTQHAVESLRFITSHIAGGESQG
ncbi:MAG: prolyl oligopeptidase family serine peptidase [Gemmatimonadaceae bacterium]|nr:prolyl oligopeptidase family serine peptidase [Gemmatimonadaceae bacterium]